MGFFDLVDKRRSIRKFSNERIPEEVIIIALKACFSQNAAKTAEELIVAVSRIDTWERNRNLLLDRYEKNGGIPFVVEKSYNRLIPLAYLYDQIGILGIAKKVLSFFISIVGFFKPVPRGPVFRHDVFEIVTKTTPLAC